MTSFGLLWEGLQRVQKVEFVARSASTTGWNGAGNGSVTVETPAPMVLLFRESGIWRPAGGRDLRFHNVYRWSYQDEALRLEHLRFGEEHPVYLFDLAPDSDGSWVSVTPHLCREDTYTARLRREGDRLFLAWTVLGPEKNEEIQYTYSSAQSA